MNLIIFIFFIKINCRNYLLFRALTLLVAQQEGHPACK